MRRRDFIGGVGGAAMWPFTARAQQPERLRRIGMLHGGNSSDQFLNDPGFRSVTEAFFQELARLGWVEGRNAHFEQRFGGGDPNRIPALAREIVGLQPDVILTDGAVPLASLQRETRTIPSGRHTVRNILIL